MMRDMNQEAVASRLVNAQAAAQTLITSSVLDMQGFDAAQFLVALGAVTDASVITVQVYENAANSNSGGTANAGAVATLTALGSSNAIMLIDVIRPTKRYLYLTIARATQNAGVDSVTAQQYRPRTIPTTQTAAQAVISAPEV